MAGGVKSISFAEGIERIIQEFELPVEFKRQTLREAEHLQQVGLPNEKREDLRQETFITIDGETARDFDDAVFLCRQKDGSYLLKVSIADVSHYVSPGSHLDQEAYSRGTSVYFPNRCLPMFPEPLSNDLCSLVPNQDRLTMTAEMHFDSEGHLRKKRFYPSIIHSVARLTYRQVHEILITKSPLLRERFRLVVPMLEEMVELFEALRKSRIKRGSLDFDLPEPEIILDMDHESVEQIIKAERYISHRMIEEFMIAANEAVASFITEKKVSTLYRIHEAKNSEKISALKILLHNLGLALPAQKQLRPLDLAKVVRAVQGKPYEKLVNTVLLRALGRAVYDSQNRGHFGLASSCYTHFTSPIRRYPDLVVHRILKSVLKMVPQNDDLAVLHSERHLRSVAEHCSERERWGMKSEWASRDLAGAFFMKDKVGERFMGIIAGVSKAGLYVELLGYFIEGLVPMRNLKDDYYVFREKQDEIVGRRNKKKYRLGDPVSVRVEKINLEKRWIDLCLANDGPA